MPVDGIVVVETFYFIRRFAWSIFVFPVVEEFGEHSVRTEFEFFPEDPEGGELRVCETHLGNYVLVMMERWKGYLRTSASSDWT